MLNFKHDLLSMVEKATRKNDNRNFYEIVTDEYTSGEAKLAAYIVNLSKRLNKQYELKIKQFTAVIPIFLLRVDFSYQRKHEDATVNNLIKNWDPNKDTPIIVSYRNGKFYVIDGYTHLDAKRTLGEVNALCIVLFDLTQEQEANLFATQYDNCKKVSAFRKYTASILAGDKNAINIDKILKSNGLNPSDGLAERGDVICFKKLNDHIKKYGIRGLTLEVKALIKSGWDACNPVSIARRAYSSTAFDIVAKINDNNITSTKDKRFKNLILIMKLCKNYDSFKSVGKELCPLESDGRHGEGPFVRLADAIINGEITANEVIQALQILEKKEELKKLEKALKNKKSSKANK